MVLLALVLLWVLVAVIVVGLCAAASHGDRKQAASLMRAVAPRPALPSGRLGA